jgi:hypothetical protein
MAGLEDILGLGKAGDKLIDVVGKGIGSLYSDWVSPHATVRKIKMLSAAQTEAEHAKVVAQTTSLLEVDAMAQRAGKRLIIQELRRQNNIERIVSLTADQLKGVEVNERPVSTDWATRFFESAKDVTDADVQELWAKILAGEIKAPGTFNLRTLEILRNITKDEAALFAQKACPLVLEGSLIIKVDNKSNLTDYGLNFGEILQLRDAGLILGGDSTVTEYKDIQGKTLTFNGKTQGVITRSTNATFSLPIYLLSAAGRELYTIQAVETSKKYIDDLDAYFKKNGFEDISGMKQETVPQSLES